MKVSEVIDFAVSGELAPLGVADIGTSSPESRANTKKIIGYLNQGLIELYKRFTLATQSITLETVVDGTSYDMGTDFMYITRAVGDDPNQTEIPVNDEKSDISIFTPTPFQLIVGNNPLSTNEDIKKITNINITYIAMPSLMETTLDVVPLPYQYLEALVNYMAYKAYGALSGSIKEDNNTYYNRFQASCNKLKSAGLMSDDYNHNTKLYDRGFV